MDWWKSGWTVKFVQQNESKPCFDRLGHMWNENSMYLMYGFTKAMSQKHGFPHCTATISGASWQQHCLLRYWVYALEDALDIIAKIPSIAAKIYRRTFSDGVVPEWTGVENCRAKGIWKPNIHFSYRDPFQVEFILKFELSFLFFFLGCQPYVFNTSRDFLPGISRSIPSIPCWSCFVHHGLPAFQLR